MPLGATDALLALQAADDRFGLLGRLAEAAAREGLAVRAVDEPPDCIPSSRRSR